MNSISRIGPQQTIEGQSNGTSCPSYPENKLSMSSLIAWNISKVFKLCPNIDLKSALMTAQERLARESRDQTPMTSLKPEEQHLTCALLAWQQMGHEDIDSLIQLAVINSKSCSENGKEKKRIEYVEDVPGEKSSIRDYKKPDTPTSDLSTPSFTGPVVRLPMQTKIVMRVDNFQCQHGRRPIKCKKSDDDVKNKLDAACCMDSACSQKLAEVGAVTSELRTRAARLAKREAERVELLERAEAAWKDLERGYQRRLSLAEEKETDTEKEIKKLLEERNNYKEVCLTLAQSLRERGANAEKLRDRLIKVEKGMCEKACARLCLGEEVSRGDALLAEQHCRITQLDRDLMFKEEQARRKLSSIKSEVDSERGLTFEIERALRSDLSDIKEQIKKVSEELLTEEANQNILRNELDDLNKQKAAILEVFEGCKIKCEKSMQKKVTELKSKQQQLEELKEKVISCQCKIPIDVAVEVRRTPSLAAICKCLPEDKFLESCSCTSLRTQLMSNLLVDLFEGLQSELAEAGSLMPCQLLKCLEDKHNWDRAGDVKTHLRNYFSQLLVEELNIAIATSIERYHAQWVGASCADEVKIRPESTGGNSDWQERYLERRAQQLASQLAEQLFKDKADELTKKAKEVLATGPPPCDCKPQQAAVYPCLVKTGLRKTVETSYVKRTLQDVTQLKAQIEDLKKESIKKGDLKKMEDKLTRIVHRATKIESVKMNNKSKCNQGTNNETNDKSENNKDNKLTNKNKTSGIRKDFIDCNMLNKYNKTFAKTKSGGIKKEKPNNKLFKNLEHSYAINVCLCGSRNLSNHVTNISKVSKVQENQLSDAANVKNSKPITLLTKDIANIKNGKRAQDVECPSNCVCFHRVPSDTSINKILEKFTKWSDSCYNRLSRSIQKLENSYLEIEDTADVIKLDKENESGLRLLNLQKIETMTPIAKNKRRSFANDHKYGTYNNILPTSTVSEYMGAINLDKSNENLCKCVMDNSKDMNLRKNINGTHQNPGPLFSGLLDTHIILNPSDKMKMETKVTGDNVEKNEINLKNKRKSFENVLEKNVSDDINKVNANNDSFVSDVIKKSELNPYDCNYCVKFLGVTLARKDNVQTSKSPTNEQNDPHINININENNKPNNKSTRCNLSSCKHAQAIKPANDKDHIKSTEEKSMSDQKKGCICCINKLNVTDVEMNAFNLLEEHLKVKFRELKENCDSIAIAPEEEKKIFSSILDKIKQLIMDNTCDLTCKCLFENQQGGTWSRAYGLLKEYLKLKIKRVQCVCSKNKTIETDLSNVLEKVNALIENDFKQLKLKYTAENTNSEIKPTTKNSDYDASFKSFKNFIESGIQADFSNVFSNIWGYKPCKNSNTISAQVSYNFNSENKCCENYLPTAEKTTSCELRNNVYMADCDCRYTFIDTNFPEFQDFKKELKNNETEDTVSEALSKDIKSSENTLEKASETQFKIPYIGCTLSCTCDWRLGPCNCSKSLAKVYSNNVNYIWQSITNECLLKGTSYIMNKVPAEIEPETNACNQMENVIISNNKRVQKCISKHINTTYDEEIVLKDSFDKHKREYNDFGTNNDKMNYIDEPKSENNDCIVNKSTSNDGMCLNKKTFKALNLPADCEVATTDNCDLSCTTDKGQEHVKNFNRCNCESVPICHVKMLVEDINRKLYNSECICDSLTSDVCPLHSKFC